MTAKKELCKCKTVENSKYDNIRDMFKTAVARRTTTATTIAEFVPRGRPLDEDEKKYLAMTAHIKSYQKATLNGVLFHTLASQKRIMDDNFVVKVQYYDGNAPS